MQQDIRLIDIVIELLDARAPESSRNPELDRLSGTRARLMILNKADLADEKATAIFSERLRRQGFEVASMDSRRSDTAKVLNEAIKRACREKLEKNRKKGIINRPMRAMVTGIPNVGKSTLINTLAGRASTKTGNRPGVTKGKQWIRLNDQVELLDTPGVLYPKFETEIIGERLALIGSINDDIIDKRELALSFISFLLREKPEALKERYAITPQAEALFIKTPDTGSKKERDAALFRILMEIAENRGALLRGGEADPDRAASILLEDFRAGRLGRITLDHVDQSPVK